MRVSAGNHQGQSGLFFLVRMALVCLPFVQQNSMDVALQMVYRDQWQPCGERKALRIGDAHQQRSCQSWAGSNGERVEVRERCAGLGERGSHHRTMARRCSRLASSGTTPPYCA